MPDQGNDTAANWFHRHPKKTLVAVTLLFILVIVFGAEKFLKFNSRRQGILLEVEAERRYVRLKEFRPGTRMLMTMPRNHLPFTDNVFTKQYRVEIDRNGFIAPSRKYDAPDKVIVFLGGSTTECMFVDQDQRFPYVTGRILEQETGAKINSYNGGMSGSDSLNAIDILINKVIPLKPDVVVFMENINDLSTLLYEGTYWHDGTARSPLETLKKRPIVGKLLKEIFIPHLNQAYKNLGKTLSGKEEDEFAGARGKTLVIDQAKMERDFAANLRTIVCICKAWGIVPVLMTQANRITEHPDPVVAAYVARGGRDRGINYQRFKALYDAFHDTIREVGQKNQVMVIDLAREVPSDKKHLYDMVHLNDAGSQLAAQIIAARLKGVIAPQ
jgi:lysophospholipase L1-like esterase